MHYIWFWTFWHWSKESFRSGTILRGPLQGIGGHWDEWFRHEASETDRRSIDHVGKTVSRQRQFISWLCRHWAAEANPGKNRLVPRFVLGQLAHVPPFNVWPTFARYRTSYGLAGVKAIVLADKSPGEPGDIRPVEALLLSRDESASASNLVAEGFQAEAADLAPAVHAVKRLLTGKGLVIFLARWLALGRRPYPHWLATTLFLAWLAVLGFILILLFGPEPGESLFFVEAVLVVLWLGLTLAAVAAAGALAWSAWRVGRLLRTRLENSQLRLRMDGGLTLQGGSAGLPFSLNILSSLGRAYPRDVRLSWLWQHFFRSLRSEGSRWAATGALTADGRLKPVVLEPKLRACLKHGGIKHILTPRQPHANQQGVADANRTLTVSTMTQSQPVESATRGIRLGFAAESPQLQVHPCPHLAHALLVLGDFVDRGQLGRNIFALLVSALMLVALPDLKSVLLAYPAPIAVLPASPSPYYLWVSLDTKHPEYFSVVLESDYWSNRRAEVRPLGGVTPSTRAEIHFHRLTGMTSANEDNGIVWIERRRRFLTREFFPGERVGRYSVPYLSHLGHE